MPAPVPVFPVPAPGAAPLGCGTTAVPIGACVAPGASVCDAAVPGACPDVLGEPVYGDAMPLLATPGAAPVVTPLAPEPPTVPTPVPVTTSPPTTPLVPTSPAARPLARPFGAMIATREP